MIYTESKERYRIIFYLKKNLYRLTNFKDLNKTVDKTHYFTTVFNKMHFLLHISVN